MVLFSTVPTFSLYAHSNISNVMSVLLVNLDSIDVMALYDDGTCFRGIQVNYLDTGDSILAFGEDKTYKGPTSIAAPMSGRHIWIFESERLNLVRTVQLNSGRYRWNCHWSAMPFLARCDTRINVVLWFFQQYSPRYSEAEVVSFYLNTANRVTRMKNLCRATILSLCSHEDINLLPLPTSLLGFLKGY